MKLSISILLLLCAVPVLALPDAPTSKPDAFVAVRPSVHRPFWDRTNRIEFGVMISLAAFDMGQTCYGLARGAREINLTQSCPKNVALTAAFDTGAVGLAWLLHRTGHRKLERIPMIWKAQDNLQGIIYSKRHGMW